MERAFLVTEESMYYKDLEKCINMINIQKEFIRKFFKENNIEAVEFRIRANGFCNRVFEEWQKKEICLYIKPLGNDMNVYGRQLTVPDELGLSRFRKNSKMAKIFADECVKNKIPINVMQPDLRDYLKSLDWRSYGLQRFRADEGFYIKVSSDLLKEDDTPKGFKEIKLSEFHLKMEEFKEKNIKS